MTQDMSGREGFPIRAASWLYGHDTGASSEAIFHYMTLGVVGGATPSDSSDLGRCIRLLEHFPEWRKRMPEMSAVSADWAEIMAHWDELLRLYESDPSAASDLLTEIFYERHESGMLIRRRQKGPSS